MASESHPRPLRCELMFAALILRLWVGMRLFFSGLDKFRDAGSPVYGLEFYEGNMKKIADGIANNTVLPQQACDLYAASLGYLLVGFGILVIVGLFTRLSLLAAGLIFLSLGLGLMLLPDDGEAVMIGIQVAITAFALSFWWHDRISLDGIFTRRGKKAAKEAAEA